MFNLNIKTTKLEMKIEQIEQVYSKCGATQRKLKEGINNLKNNSEELVGKFKAAISTLREVTDTLRYEIPFFDQEEI